MTSDPERVAPANGDGQPAGGQPASEPTASRQPDNEPTASTKPDNEPTAAMAMDGTAIVGRPAGDSALSLPPFDGLQAPTPIEADPPPVARVTAFVAITVGGVLGFLIGYGIGDLMASQLWISTLAAVIGAIIGAVGVGIVANLALRAMGEWNSVEHPEHSP